MEMSDGKLIRCVVCGEMRRKPRFAQLDVCWLCVIEAVKELKL